MEVFSLSKSNYNELEYPLTKAYFKIFQTNKIETITQCQCILKYRSVQEEIISRQSSFVSKLKRCENVIIKLLI